MDSTNPFYKQVSLLVTVLPILGNQSSFALKSVTTSNLSRTNPALPFDVCSLFCKHMRFGDMVLKHQLT